jgi:hypothetical protein
LRLTVRCSLGVQGMEIPEQQRYNLPGFGYMKIRLFPSARVVFRFLERYGHVSNLREINQLGPIRDVLPGAHHTRYEYLMAQLALITALCELKGPLPTGMSLSREQTDLSVASKRLAKRPPMERSSKCLRYWGT